jgi:putative nucleotidyltransferase with HDIG domain
MLAAFKNIRFKVSFFVFLLLIATILIFYTITVQVISKHIQNEVIKRAESLSRSMASSTGYSILSKDLLSANPDIEYIAIIDTENRIIVHNDAEKSGETLTPSQGKTFKKTGDGTVITEIYGRSGPLFEITSPILFMNKQLGSVILGINKSVILDAQRTTRTRIMIVFAVTLFLGIIGSILLSSFLTRPVKELSSGVAELKEGKRTRPLRVYSQDELGRLTRNFNEMTALITEQRDRLNKYAHDLEESYVATVKVLAAAIDARDQYTHGHSARVSQLSLQLAGKVGLSDRELEELEVACLFHDVGKIKIPDSILQKNGTLTPEERTEMKRHTEYGADILSKAPSLHKLIPAVRHHHEWYNGEGYPDRLSGDKIPVFAGIICIADAFDALTSHRPYRDALSVDEALNELVNASGKQFNPELLKFFIEIIQENTVSYSHESGTATI